MGVSRLRLLVFAVLSALGFSLLVIPVGPAVSEPAPTPPADVSIDIVAFHARPDHVEIPTGTTVTWVNKEPFDYPLFSGNHEIKADDGSFASPVLAPGTRWSHRFLLPGTYKYHCAHHTDLSGEIVVTGPPIVEDLLKEVAITEPKPDDATSWGFAPNDLIVTTGTTVVWRNNGTNTHTVTSSDNLFASPDIPPGGTFSFKFDQPGAFAYHCTPHPWMTASVRVVVPGGAAPPPPVPAPPAPMAMSHASHAAGTAGSAGPVTHDIDIVEPNPANPNSYAFDPATVDVRVGDTVVWHNAGTMQHSVTADDASFDAGLIPPGGTFSRTFTTPAFLAYHCTPHPWMRGVLRVAAGTGPPPAAPASTRTPAGGSAASPPRQPVRQGAGPVTQTVNIVEPSMSDAMGWGFNPKVLDIRAGDTVVWHNTGTLQHSVTADGNGFDAGLVDPGKTFTRLFDTPGVYAYHCTPHPWMKGIVRVADAEGGAVPAIPASLDTGSGGSGGSTAPAESSTALPSPLRLFAKAASYGNAAVKLGWALLFSALIVGLTIMVSWRSPGSSPAAL